MKRVNKKAFTLLELIVVLAIIAVITAIAIPVFFGVIDNAKKSAAMEEARNLVTVLSAKMISNEKDDKELASIYLYTDQDEGNKTIAYIGPTDNSVTIDNGLHHDAAKKAIATITGKTVLTFGYRLHIIKDSNGEHSIKNIEVFYKKPTNANITAESADFSIDFQ